MFVAQIIISGYIHDLLGLYLGVNVMFSKICHNILVMYTSGISHSKYFLLIFSREVRPRLKVA